VQFCRSRVINAGVGVSVDRASLVLLRDRYSRIRQLRTEEGPPE
jgi:hypothetical protein